MSHFSPPASPPLSPMKPRNGVSSVSSLARYGSVNNSNNLRYRDMLVDLLGSFEGLNFNENSSSSCSSPVSKIQNNNMGWLDLPLNSEEQQYQQFIVSPSSSSSFDQQQQNFDIHQNLMTPSFNDIGDNNIIENKMMFLGNENNKMVVGGGEVNAPDLGWVNELLM